MFPAMFKTFTSTNEAFPDEINAINNISFCFNMVVDITYLSFRLTFGMKTG